MTETILIISFIALGLVGTLMTFYADKKTVKSKASSLVDKVAPLLRKDARIDSSTIYNEKFFEPNNRKMRGIKTTGIIFIILSAIGTIATVII